MITSMRTLLIAIAMALSLLAVGCNKNNTSTTTQQPQNQDETASAQNKEEAKESDLEFPYYAVITCGSNYNANFPAWQCFSGGNSVNTELEIRNGSAYKMYTFQEMMQMPLDNGKLVIDLRKNFE